MVVLSVLSTLGVGGIVATHAVYLSEVIGPTVRGKVLLASQSSTALVGIISQPGRLRLDSRALADGSCGLGSLFQIVVLLPLLYWLLPEVATLAGSQRTS